MCGDGDKPISLVSQSIQLSGYLSLGDVCRVLCCLYFPRAGHRFTGKEPTRDQNRSCPKVFVCCSASSGALLFGRIPGEEITTRQEYLVEEMELRSIHQVIMMITDRWNFIAKIE